MCNSLFLSILYAGLTHEELVICGPSQAGRGGVTEFEVQRRLEGHGAIIGLLRVVPRSVDSA